MVADLNVVLVVASVVTAGKVAAADIDLVSLALLFNVRELARWRAWETTGTRCWSSRDDAEQRSKGNEGELHAECS